VPPTLNDLVIHLLAKEPRARPTAAEAMVTLMKVQAFPGRNGGLTGGGRTATRAPGYLAAASAVKVPTRSPFGNLSIPETADAASPITGLSVSRKKLDLGGGLVELTESQPPAFSPSAQ
jgi:hypothetical protein